MGALGPEIQAAESRVAEEEAPGRGGDRSILSFGKISCDQVCVGVCPLPHPLNYFVGPTLYKRSGLVHCQSRLMRYVIKAECGAGADVGMRYAAAPAAAAPVTEQWVQCTKCDKWRLISQRVRPLFHSSLPSLETRLRIGCSQCLTAASLGRSTHFLHSLKELWDDCCMKRHIRLLCAAHCKPHYMQYCRND